MGLPRRRRLRAGGVVVERHEERVATDVSAVQGSRELDGWFSITATAAPERRLTELDEIIGEELGRLVADGPTDDEIERGLAQVDAQFVYWLQTVGGFNGRSDQLNAYNVYTGDPGFMSGDRARYSDSTPAVVRMLADRWLTSSGRVALSVVPEGAAADALHGSSPAVVS